MCSLILGKWYNLIKNCELLEMMIMDYFERCELCCFMVFLIE